MSDSIKEAEKLGHQQPGGDNIEGQNPTRGGHANGRKDAKRDTSTGDACATLRESPIPAALLVDRLLTTAGRAWLVAVGRLAHLEAEDVGVLPEDLNPRLAPTARGESPGLEPAYLLAHARTLGATIIACRAAYGRLPESAWASRVLRSVVAVAQVAGPSYRYQRQLEVLGLHWVEQCLSALELAASDWPEKALALAHVPEDGALPAWGEPVATLAERHAVNVVAEVLPASAPEPLSLIAQALATWETREEDVAQLVEADARLEEGREVEPRSAWQILWRIGQAAQVVARLRARMGGR